MEVKFGLGRTKMVGQFKLGIEISKKCQGMYWLRKLETKIYGELPVYAITGRARNYRKKWLI
jgi:hypothetical protein